jgi:hypothetical protein
MSSLLTNKFKYHGKQILGWRHSRMGCRKRLEHHIWRGWWRVKSDII